MLSRIGSFRASSRATGEGAISGAALLLAAESQGLAIDFTDLSMVIKDTGTPANVFSGNPNAKLTYASPSTKWILGRSGLYESGTTLRTEYDASGNPLGVRIEEARTNLFLNSRSPATQGITVSATAYTLSFIGTGTITLSGASAAGPLVGTGANNRVALTFTPTAGTLTCTVSGTMDFVQVEAGSFATSPIVTTGSSVTRAADVVSLSAGLFPISPTVGTLVACFRLPVANTAGTARLTALGLDDDGTDRFTLRAIDLAGIKALGVYGTGAGVASIPALDVVAANALTCLVLTVDAAGADLYQNGVLQGSLGAGPVALNTAASLFCGNMQGIGQLGGVLVRAVYLPRKLTGPEAVAKSTP